MTDLEIPHEYEDGAYRLHNWSGGWVQHAVDALTSNQDE